MQFLGYGDEESYWLDQLAPSAGEEVRKAQIEKAASEAKETSANNLDVTVDKSTPILETIPDGNYTLSEKSSPVIETIPEAKALTSTPNKTVIQETKVATPVANDKKIVNKSPIVNGQANGGYQGIKMVNGTQDESLDVNNNLDINEAINKLMEEVKSIRTINSLRRILEIRDEEIRTLKEKISVSDTVIQEMRETNLYLHRENQRLQDSEAKSNQNVAQLCADIKTMLCKVNIIQTIIDLSLDSKITWCLDPFADFTFLLYYVYETSFYLKSNQFFGIWLL